MIDKQTLKAYFNPVKALKVDVKRMARDINKLEQKLKEVNCSCSLKTEVDAVNKRLESLESLPASHLSGSGSADYGPISDESTITTWYNRSDGSTWSPYLRGGMTYLNGILTVPQDGLYYVYTQLWFYHARGKNYYGIFSIDVNGSWRAYSNHYSKDNHHTYYVGRLLNLQKGDRISIVMRSGNNYLFTDQAYSFFGAFRLP